MAASWVGPLIALTCAFSWSVAIILFKWSGPSIPPFQLNLQKNIVGFIGLIATTWAIEGFGLPDLSLGQTAILMGSGLLGIGIADALVLRALQMIPANHFAIVECCFSPFVMALAVLYLGEVLTWEKITGAAFVIAAVALMSRPERDAQKNHDRTIVYGIGLAIGGILCMALGITAIVPLFEEVTLWWIITIRMGAGVFGSYLLVRLTGKRLQRDLLLWQIPRAGAVFLACLLSSYVSMMLWVAGYKYNEASITAVLNQTATIFTVLLAVLFLKEPLTKKTLLGTASAIAGVFIITLS